MTAVPRRYSPPPLGENTPKQTHHPIADNIFGHELTPSDRGRVKHSSISTTGGSAKRPCETTCPCREKQSYRGKSWVQANQAKREREKAKEQKCENKAGRREEMRARGLVPRWPWIFVFSLLRDFVVPLARGYPPSRSWPANHRRIWAAMKSEPVTQIRSSAAAIRRTASVAAAASA